VQHRSTATDAESTGRNAKRFTEERRSHDPLEAYHPRHRSRALHRRHDGSARVEVVSVETTPRWKTIIGFLGTLYILLAMVFGVAMMAVMIWRW
jgi:hypothetical protein